MKERIEKMKNSKKKGFTLIELVVVIAILAILALIMVPNFYGYIDKSRDARIQSDLKKVYSAAIVSIEDSDEIRLSDAVERSDIFNESIKSLVNFSSEKDDEQDYERYKFLNKQNQLVVEYKDVNGKIHYYPKEVGMIGGGETGETGENEPGETGETKPVYPDPDEEIILIETAEQLNSIRDGLDKHYILDASIDLSEYSEDFNPIGTDSSPFTGSFNGQGHSIYGLKINRTTTDYVGLFGYTKGAIIRNVVLENINVTGRNYVGGLVGYANNSIIKNLENAFGSVTGADNVGGLVGMADNSIIEDSRATVSVEGINKVGGLVGLANRGTEIINSSAFGSVTGKNSLGGLVGLAENSTIENSSAFGTVTGTGDDVGGLVGRANSSTINNSSAYGSVEGINKVGRLVGRANSSTINNSLAEGSVTGTGDDVGGLVGYADDNTEIN